MEKIVYHAYIDNSDFKIKDNEYMIDEKGIEIEKKEGNKYKYTGYYTKLIGRIILYFAEGVEENE